MLEKLRGLITAYLTHHQIGVLDVTDVHPGEPGEGIAMPVRYRLLTGVNEYSLGLECLIPRWADIAYYLEQEHRVSLIVLACYVPDLRWLQYRGIAYPINAPDWGSWLPRWTSIAPPDELYQVIRIIPRRITIFNETQGWGVRETLELSTDGSLRAVRTPSASGLRL